MANVVQREVTGWVGWSYFAAFMLLMSGFFQLIMGLTALLNDQFYTQLNGQLVVFDFTQWGWIHLVVGVVMLVAGTSLFAGSTWARVIAVILAGFNLLTQFAFVGVYPIWSIIMMVVDVLVIYALTVHGAELRENV